jgi:phosphoesterase RecJ-like protein
MIENSNVQDIQNEKNSSATAIWEALNKSQKPLCIMDSRFDFDSLCSAVFLHKIIKRLLNKEVKLVCEYSSVNDNVGLLGIDTSAITFGVDPKTIDLSKYDLLITLDSGKLEHLSKTADYELSTSITLLNIDHHAVNSFYGNLNYVRNCASTTSQLFRLFRELNTFFEPEELRLLTVGLIVDSGFFSYSSPIAEDFEMAAYVSKSGVKIFDIIHTLQFNVSFDTYKLRKLVYSNMSYIPEAKVIWSFVTDAELKDNKISVELINEPAADMLKYLTGIDYAFVIRPVPNEEFLWNVSFRSHSKKFNSRVLAMEFGGGGHDMASGCTIKHSGSIEEVASIVIDKVFELKASGTLES